MCPWTGWSARAEGERERVGWLVGWHTNTKKVSHGVVAVGQASTYGTDGTIQDPEWMRKKDRDRIQWYGSSTVFGNAMEVQCR